VCRDGTKHLKSLDTHMETDKIFQVVVFHLFICIWFSPVLCYVLYRWNRQQEKKSISLDSHSINVSRLSHRISFRSVGCAAATLFVSLLFLSVCVGGCLNSTADLCVCVLGAHPLDCYVYNSVGDICAGCGVRGASKVSLSCGGDGGTFFRSFVSDLY
jgi:hypothetical protein